MTAFSAPTTARTFPGLGKGLVAAALGAALVLAVAAGIGVQQRADRVTSTIAIERAPSVVSAAPASRVKPAGTILTIHIVGSADEKLRLERALDEANTIRASQGDLPLEDQVFVAASAEEADRIAESLARLHDEARGGAIKVNDLRAPAPAPKGSTMAGQDGGAR